MGVPSIYFPLDLSLFDSIIFSFP